VKEGGCGCGDDDLGCRNVQCRVTRGLGFRASGFGLRVSGFGFRVSGFGFRVSGIGYRV
jgi:hypothetical protein